MNTIKREIIFPIQGYKEYRVACRIGYSDLIPWAWHAHIEKRVAYKKYFLFGEIKYKWVEIDHCWFSKTIESVEQLKEKALDFYDEKILFIPRLLKKNICIE